MVVETLSFLDDNKKESRFLLNALTTIKRNENEIMDEFNLKFDKLVHDIPHNLQRSATTVLLCYPNAF
jgi:hypothetical protein